MSTDTQKSNRSGAARKMMRVVRQGWRGMPYAQKEFGRCMSVRLGRPLVAPQMYYVIFGSLCNACCTFCSSWQAVDAPMIPGEAMLRLIQQAHELSGSGFNISLSGGEPLAYRPIFEVLELAHKLKVNIGFTTNGYLLTRENVARALAANPFNINISLESVDPAVNESVRPRKNGTEQTLQGIDHIVAEKRRAGVRTAIVVKPTIMEQNYRSLPGLVKYFSRDSEVQVNLQPYLGSAQDPHWVKDPDELERVAAELKQLRAGGCGLITDDAALDGFVRYFRNPPKSNQPSYLKLNGHKRGCDIGYRTLTILADGSVHFCDLLQSEIGNIHQQSLKDIYFGEKAAKQRHRIAFCNIDCQRVCQRPIPITTKIRAFLRMA